jgi:hypothetical protein
MARTRAMIRAAARNGMAVRRPQVAALLQPGFQPRPIAEQLGASAATVSGDCAVLREQWRVAAGEVAGFPLARLLADLSGWV